jgi:16S rRNA (guanine966-N2)-methyltransferase
MRIISGNFKGKKLFLPKDKNTRPLKDVVKESIFNIINHSNLIDVSIANSNILDLFSGSGSFGLECISRGAKKVTFIENHINAIEILKKNLKDFNNYKIIKKDCFKFFENKKIFDLKFDIIFIDPPFKEIRINEIISKIKKNRLLLNNGVLIIHRHKQDNVQITKEMTVIEERFYGLSKIYFGN